MKLFLTIAPAVSLIMMRGVDAQSGAWGQCGGIEWTGATICVAGWVCTYSTPYYSQCLPGTLSSSARTTDSVVTTTAHPTATTTQLGTTATTTTTSPAATGSQIRTVQDPVYHFYLQDIGGVPVLGPESSSGYFTIGNTISLSNTSGSKLYLNIGTGGTASYKPLTLDATATTTDWGLEGDTIITTSPRQLNFLACATNNTTIYNVYLQEGNDTPTEASCTLVTMHLPCLC
ncbi:putative mannan endo-1,4-beta-mannosidase F [Termitomyces sp. T112]|nr:putative mannan endo-1,4-beta-mannosidase F [Termitomyces sp. T112]